jgi:hypothetical protein
MRKPSRNLQFHASKHFDKPQRAKRLVALALLLLVLLVTAACWALVFNA